MRSFDKYLLVMDVLVQQLYNSYLNHPFHSKSLENLINIFEIELIHPQRRFGKGSILNLMKLEHLFYIMEDFLDNLKEVQLEERVFWKLHHYYDYDYD